MGIDGSSKIVWTANNVHPKEIIKVFRTHDNKSSPIRIDVDILNIYHRCQQPFPILIVSTMLPIFSIVWLNVGLLCVVFWMETLGQVANELQCIEMVEQRWHRSTLISVVSLP